MTPLNYKVLDAELKAWWLCSPDDRLAGEKNDHIRTLKPLFRSVHTAVAWEVLKWNTQ